MAPADGVQEKNGSSAPYRTLHQAAPCSSLPSSSSLHGVPWNPFIPAAHIASCLRTLTAYSNQPGCGETAIDRNTYGVNESLVPLSESDVPVFHIPKNVPTSDTIRRPNENLPTKQRAPPSQKRAGPQTTCRTARIEHQSLT